MLRNNLVLSAYVDSKLDNQCTSKSLLDIGILLYTGFETRQTSISLTESLQSADRDCLVLRTTIWLVLDLQKGNSPVPVATIGRGTRLSTTPDWQMIEVRSRRRPECSSLLHGRMRHPVTGNAPRLQCPKVAEQRSSSREKALLLGYLLRLLPCMIH